MFVARALAAATAVFLVACTGGDDQHSNGRASLGGDFTLDSEAGPVALKDYRGRFVLLYFGYTHCPDVCPTTLANVGEALDMLSDSERAEVAGMFITVDPGRDSVAIVAEYARYFHPQIIGLSGGKEELEAVARNYQVFFNKYYDQDAGSDQSYKVAHADYLFLIDSEGAVADMMSHNTSPENIVAAVRKQFAEKR